MKLKNTKNYKLEITLGLAAILVLASSGLSNIIETDEKTYVSDSNFEINFEDRWIGGLRNLSYGFSINGTNGNRVFNDSNDNIRTKIENSNGGYWDRVGSNIASAVTNLRPDGGTVWIPKGDYTISTTINCTNFTAGKHLTIIMDKDADISGQTTGFPVFDFTNSSYATITGGHITGHSVSTPSCGFLFGRISAGYSADLHYMRGTLIDGSYTNASVYVLGSESLTFQDVFINNDYATGFGMKIVGSNNDSIVSPWTPAPVGGSMTNINIYGGYIKYSGGGATGSALFIGRGDVRNIEVYGTYMVSNGLSKIEFEHWDNLNGPFVFDSVRGEGASTHFIYSYVSVANKDISRVTVRGCHDGGATGNVINADNGDMVGCSFMTGNHFGDATNNVLYVAVNLQSSRVERNVFDTVESTRVYDCYINLQVGGDLDVSNSLYDSDIYLDTSANLLSGTNVDCDIYYRDDNVAEFGYTNVTYQYIPTATSSPYGTPYEGATWANVTTGDYGIYFDTQWNWYSRKT